MTVRVLERCLRIVRKSIFCLPEACLWWPSHANTMLPEPCYWEGRLLALAQGVVPSAAGPVQLTNRLWLHPGEAILGPSPMSCYQKTWKSTNKGIYLLLKISISLLKKRELTFNKAKLNKGKLNYSFIWIVLWNCGTGTEGTALCQEKAPAEEPEHGQGQSPQTQL